MKRNKTSFLLLAALYSLLPAALSAQMTWTCADSSTPWSRSCHTSVVFDNKMWLIGGAYTTSSTYVDTNDVWYSTDGANWTCVTQSAPWLAREGHTSVVFDNKMWVIGGAHWDGIRYIYLNDVWSSTDGANWTPVTNSAQWSIRTYHTSVVHDGKMWVIGGEDAYGFFTEVWNSTNGDSWILVTDTAQWQSRAYHTSVAFHDTMWLLGGAYWTGNRWVLMNDIWSSTDGLNWTCVTESAPWSPRACHSSVVFNNDIWVIGGTTSHPDPSLRVNDVWHSTDGVNWIYADTSADWSPRGWHSSVIYNNKIWVIGGDSTENFYTMCDVWNSTGIGIEESPTQNTECITPIATIVRDVLNLQSAISHPQSEIFLLDITGRKVADLKSSANNIQHLAPGVYFIRSINNNQVTKIIVTR